MFQRDESRLLMRRLSDFLLITLSKPSDGCIHRQDSFTKMFQNSKKKNFKSCCQKSADDRTNLAASVVVLEENIPTDSDEV